MVQVVHYVGTISSFEPRAVTMRIIIVLSIIVCLELVVQRSEMDSSLYAKNVRPVVFRPKSHEGSKECRSALRQDLAFDPF